MIKHGDAEQVASLAETGGESAILGTGFRISRWVIVGADESGGIQEDSRFEDFAGMDDAECQGADGNDIDADDGVFGVETADEELLSVEPGKEGTEGGRGADGIVDDNERAGRAAARHQTDSVARNKSRRGNVRVCDDREVGIVYGGLVCHVGTSLLLSSLALSLELESQCRTTGGDRDVPAGEAQADENEQRA